MHAPDPGLSVVRSTPPPGTGPVLRLGLEDRPAPAAGLLYAVQHVMIMFGAMLASPLAIGQLLGMDPAQRSLLITGIMLGAGIGTLLSSLGAFWVGGRLPLLLGPYAVFIGPFVAIAHLEGLAAAATAMMTGGVALLALSPLVGRLRPAFPPLVIGTLLLMTGIGLIKIAVNLAVGANTPYFAKPVAAAMLLGSMLLIVVLLTFTKGFVRSLSVFLTVVAVYAVAASIGLANLQPVWNAAWFQLPHLLPFGLAWPSPGAVTTVLIYQLVSAIYTMSITIALCNMLQVEASLRRVRGAIAADGLGSFITTLLGGVPLISYDQNVGAIALTGIGSRFVVAIAGLLLAAASFLPKVTALITSVPPFVLGGTLIFMFGTIAVVGVQILAPHLQSQRNILIVAIALALSVAVSFAPPALFDMVAPSARPFMSDGIVLGTIAAVVLNLVLPAS